MRGALVAWLATCAAMGCLAKMRYSDIEMLGVHTCPHQDSCSLIRSGNFSSRNCECDPLCAAYNDCCIDAAARSPAARTRDVCMPFGDSYLGAYVVATCPGDSASALADQCEGGDFRDPLLSTPVTDAGSRRTYRNSYCAQCNGAAPDLQPWILRVQCPGAGNFTWEDVTRSRSEWAVRGRPCELHFDRPTELRGGPRLCRANLTDTCPPNSRRRTNAEACEAYLSMVEDKDRVTYRNPHCALCNGKTVDDLSCFSGSTLGRGRKQFSYALLLDVNQRDGNLVGVSGSSETCPNGQKFDPFFKKCRPLMCGIPGYTLSNGKCVKQ